MRVGDLLPFKVLITSLQTGSPQDATEVTLVVTRDVDGVAVTYLDVQSTPGHPGLYEVDHLTSAPGRHVGVWTATGLNSSSETQAFAVDGEDLSLLSLAAAKQHLNIPLDKTADDGELEAMLASVTELIEAEVGAVVVRTVVEQHPGGAQAIVLKQWPVLSVTGVTDSGAAVDPSGYELDEGVLWRTPGWWPCGSSTRFPVEVTYRAGRAVVPGVIGQAARAALKLMWRSQRGPARQASTVDDGTTSVTPYALPYEVLQLLAPHRQPPTVA